MRVRGVIISVISDGKKGGDVMAFRKRFSRGGRGRRRFGSSRRRVRVKRRGGIRPLRIGFRM